MLAATKDFWREIEMLLWRFSLDRLELPGEDWLPTKLSLRGNPRCRLRLAFCWGAGGITFRCFDAGQGLDGVQAHFWNFGPPPSSVKHLRFPMNFMPVCFCLLNSVSRQSTSGTFGVGRGNGGFSEMSGAFFYFLFFFKPNTVWSGEFCYNS